MNNVIGAIIAAITLGWLVYDYSYPAASPSPPMGARLHKVKPAAMPAGPRSVDEIIGLKP